MQKFTRLSASAAALAAANIDTDVIMPKQFLKGIDREGLAIGLFHDLRFLPDGQPDARFVLNRPDMADTRILVTGPNFGCGSSREHAVWGLLQYGIRAIIGTSFGGIFADNAANNGLLLVSLKPDELAPLAREVAARHTRIAIDLESRTIATDTQILSFDIDPAVRDALMLGLDRIGQTLARSEHIRAFEAAYLRDRPWLGDGPAA